jgi:Fe-Mn family superoxide dismutase
MYILPSLPYNFNELEPFIDKEIMELHYNKHHKGYLDKLNSIISTYDPTLFDTMSETTMAMYINTFPIAIKQDLKNQLGGHVNHSFFWALLSKNDTTHYRKLLEPLFKDQFGSIEQALDEFKEIAKKHFGSGWVWVCYNPVSENLEIRAYNNQDCPLFDNMYPLFGIDLWEHAYYLQYKNDKAMYIDAFIKIINWKHVYELFNSYHENHDEQNCCNEDKSGNKGCCDSIDNKCCIK